MSPEIFLIAIVAMMWSAMRWRFHGRSGPGLEANREELQRLADLVESLHDDLQLMRDDVVELQERVDFTERALTRGPIGDPEPHRISTPA